MSRAKRGRWSVYEVRFGWWIDGTLFVGMVDVEEQSQVLGIGGPCMKGLFT